MVAVTRILSVNSSGGSDPDAIDLQDTVTVSNRVRGKTKIDEKVKIERIFGADSEYFLDQSIPDGKRLEMVYKKAKELRVPFWINNDVRRYIVGIVERSPKALSVNQILSRVREVLKNPKATPFHAPILISDSYETGCPCWSVDFELPGDQLRTILVDPYTGKILKDETNPFSLKR